MIALRVTAVALLLILVWNPVRTTTARDRSPLVLLDHSLSMPAHGRDTARRLAGPGGQVLAFGDGVTALDSGTPAMGRSHLGPALVQAAARGGATVIVSDGEIEDLADIAPDLLMQAGVVLVPRDTAPSVALVDVHGPVAVSARDTVRFTALLAAWGADLGPTTRLVADAGGRAVGSATVPTPPPGGTARAEVLVPASRLGSGPQAVTLRIDDVAGDGEPRDDQRIRIVDVTPLPAVVVLGTPADWDVRFFAATVRDVAQVPVRAFVVTQPGRWRDAETLGPVSPAAVQAAARAAALVVWRGPEAGLDRFRPERGAVLRWQRGGSGGLGGDWYVTAPPPSPIAAALAGARWDSLPPLTALVPTTPGAGTWVGLTARLARRGADWPVVLGTDSGGRRSVTIAASELWRWAFRGGSEREAYRALVAGASDWLLGDRAARRDPVAPVATAVPRATPLVFARRDTTLHAVELTLSGDSTVIDTLVFDAAGHAAIRVPPGVYRYQAAGNAGEGLVAVEEYSDEFHPRPVALTTRPPSEASHLVHRALRDHWWLFAVAVALFTAEWVWRRRRGLP